MPAIGECVRLIIIHGKSPGSSAVQGSGECTPAGACCASRTSLAPLIYPVCDRFAYTYLEALEGCRDWGIGGLRKSVQVVWGEANLLFKAYKTLD